MDFNDRDDRFLAFAKSLEGILHDHGENTTERQKAQVENLVKLEKQFRRTLIRHRSGKAVYKAFISYIMDERRNILEARPFFRERNETFTGFISDLFRKRNFRGLYKYHFNYNFIKFVMKARKWGKSSPITKLRDQIVDARKELIEMNMKLAIRQANIFYGKMQKAHLDRMDFIQIATEGLIATIDKYCLPYRTVFRTVATHRMKGNFIDSYSETPIHFYPKDKRRLYQAFKFIRSQSGRAYSMDDLVTYVNKNVKPNEQTDVSEMVNLLGAASVVSADSLPVNVNEEADDEGATILDKYSDTDAISAHSQIEDAELRYNLFDAIQQLSVLEQKLLILKGMKDVD